MTMNYRLETLVKNIMGADIFTKNSDNTLFTLYAGSQWMFEAYLSKTVTLRMSQGKHCI